MEREGRRRINRHIGNLIALLNVFFAIFSLSKEISENEESAILKAYLLLQVFATAWCNSQGIVDRYEIAQLYTVAYRTLHQRIEITEVFVDFAKIYHTVSFFLLKRKASEF